MGVKALKFAITAAGGVLEYQNAFETNRHLPNAF